MGGLQGGGPELTALSNVLRRPISIYELAPLCEEEEDTVGPETLEERKEPPLDHLERWRIREVGTFGNIFEDPLISIPDSAVLSGLQPGAYSWHLHILVVDVGQGEKHACTLLPQFCDAP